MKIKSKKTTKRVGGIELEKPSENTEKMWIRTGGQLTEAEEKQRKVTPDRISEFLEEKGFLDFTIHKPENSIKLVPIGEDNQPLKLGEETIDEMADELGLKTGKWNIYLDEGEVDEAWELVKELCEENEKISAKVATKRNAELTQKSSYVICVYTEDYQDKEEVMRVRDLLEEAGFEETLYYKPDIYTVLGIYSDSARDFGLEGASKYKK